MRRLEAVIPGPINAIYGETVAGIAVIRAFGVQSVFVQGQSTSYTVADCTATDLNRAINMRTVVWAWRMYTSRWIDGEWNLL